MRKVLLTMFALAGALTCNAQTKCSVEISLPLHGGEMIKVSVTDDAMMAVERTDSFALPADGKYTYSLNSDHIKFVNIVGKDGNYGLVLRPDEVAKVSGTSLKDAHVSGSPYYESQEKVVQQEKPINEEMDAFRQDIMSRASSGKYDEDSLKVEMKERSAEFEKRLTDLYKGYVKQNPDDEYSVFLLSRLIMEYDANKSLLTPRVLGGKMQPFVTVMDAMAERIKQRMQASEKLQSGMEVPEIDGLDINGKPFSMASLRGKLVVLDFWGSWCGWCIKGMPKMKEYYQKYKGKLEIVGVDCNDTEAKWKAAVEKHQLPWLHVRSIPKENDISVKYAVTAFPTKVLIGADGKIIKTFVGEADDFYKTIDEVLGK